MTLDQSMDAESGYRLTGAVQEKGLIGRPFAYQRSEGGNGDRPQWAETLLSTLPGNLHAGIVLIHVNDFQLTGFRGSGPRVIEEQQESVIATTLCCSPIWGTQQSVHFQLLKIRDESLAGLFKWNRANLAAPFDVSWAILAYKVCKGTDGSKPSIAGGNTAVPRRLEID